MVASGRRASMALLTERLRRLAPGLFRGSSRRPPASLGSKSWRALSDAVARLTAFPRLFANGMLRVVFLPPDTGGPMASRSLPRPRPLLALLVLVCVLVGVA